MTITQRLFTLFSLLAVSLITLVIVAVLVLTGFQSRFQYIQSNATPPLSTSENWWTAVTS